ncbi:MAG: hypothetical protein ACYC5A_03525 [Thermoleophilia bacterium]
MDEGQALFCGAGSHESDNPFIHHPESAIIQGNQYQAGVGGAEWARSMYMISLKVQGR